MSATQLQNLMPIASGSFWPLSGPFDSGQFAAALDPSLPLRAEWATIFQHVPLILTVAASSLIGATLNASGLELALGRDLDIDKEIKGTGIDNIVSGIFGGVPGYHVMGETPLARRLGLTGALAGVSAAAGCSRSPQTHMPPLTGILELAAKADLIAAQRKVPACF